MYIKGRIKPIFHFFLPKIIRNIKFPPATVHFAPPHTTMILTKLAALYRNFQQQPIFATQQHNNLLHSVLSTPNLRFKLSNFVGFNVNCFVCYVRFG